MLRLSGGPVESLLDEALAIEVRELPEDLAGLDGLLSDPAVLAPVEAAWEHAARGHGRPTVPIECFVRLVVKQRTGWGHETLVREVSDSPQLRRFCLIALSERVPDEPTIRKLCRRLGPDVIEQICRGVIGGVVRQRRFTPRAARIDSTVVESDVRYPSDLGLAADATRILAREAGRLAGSDASRVRDRSRAADRRLRTLNRTLARRTGQGKETALRLTGQAGQLVARSVSESRRLIVRLRQRARGRGAQAKLAGAQRLDKVADQIAKRVSGEITDRLVSLSDPDARPVRKGKLRQPTEFGSVFQICEITENTRRGARGLIVPAASKIGSPNESDLLPATGGELVALDIAPHKVALDGGFAPGPSRHTCPPDNAPSSVGARAPGHGAPTGAWRATASVPKDATATSNAATAPSAADSRAMRAPARGWPGPSWPTTSTPSPSEPPDTIRMGASTRAPTTTTAAPPTRARPLFIPAPSAVSRALVCPGQVASMEAITDFCTQVRWWHLRISSGLLEDIHSLVHDGSRRARRSRSTRNGIAMIHVTAGKLAAAPYPC